METDLAAAPPAAEYATVHVHTVARDTSLEDVDRELRDRNISAVAVADALGNVVGVCSRSDLLATCDSEPGETLRLPPLRVEEVMSSPALTVSADADVRTAATSMLAHGYHRVFLHDGERVVGVLSTLDLMRSVQDAKVRRPVESVAERGIVTVDCAASLADAVQHLEDAGRRGLVVMDRGWPVGLFTQGDALLARAHDPASPVEHAMDMHIFTVPPRMPLERAAAQAFAMGVHRIVVTDGDHPVGMVSGLDFARVWVEGLC